MDTNPNGEILETPDGSQPEMTTADEGIQGQPECALEPSAEEVGNMRCAGFHIHMGVKERMTIDDIELYIFCMDVCCGLRRDLLERLS